MKVVPFEKKEDRSVKEILEYTLGMDEEEAFQDCLVMTRSQDGTFITFLSAGMTVGTLVIMEKILSNKSSILLEEEE